MNWINKKISKLFVLSKLVQQIQQEVKLQKKEQFHFQDFGIRHFYTQIINKTKNIQIYLNVHEKFGYYMKQDVFNKDGDFVTSVEISQMFNELIGIWLLNTFQHIGVLDSNFRPTQQKMHILEFGPGLGINIQYSYVEYSDYMRKKQQEAVLKQLQKNNIYPKFEYNDQKVEKFESEEIKLKWFKMYEHFLYEETREGLNCDPVLIIAHEFFDALPINIFEFSGGHWCERLVGLDKDGKTLKFILSNGPNQNVQKILNPDKYSLNQFKIQLIQLYFSPEIKKLIKEGDTIEISPQSGVIANSLAELIAKVGGAALIIDYGEKRAFSDSVRAIQRHKLMDKNDILNKPGDCDLSAYVNFMALEQAALKVDGIKVPELMTQGNWLEQMGISARLQVIIIQLYFLDSLQKCYNQFNYLKSKQIFYYQQLYYNYQYLFSQNKNFILIGKCLEKLKNQYQIRILNYIVKKLDEINKIKNNILVAVTKQLKRDCNLNMRDQCIQIKWDQISSLCVFIKPKITIYSLLYKMHNKFIIELSNIHQLKHIFIIINYKLNIIINIASIDIKRR